MPVKKILIVDDSPTERLALTELLHKHGYQVFTSESGDEGVAKAKELMPDLILMDITMPDINGYKLCSLFRNSEALATTPIIMVTGNKGLVDRVRANMVGATDYLTKPFTQPELLEMVEKYLT